MLTLSILDSSKGNMFNISSSTDKIIGGLGHVVLLADRVEPKLRFLRNLFHGDQTNGPTDT